MALWLLAAGFAAPQWAGAQADQPLSPLDSFESVAGPDEEVHAVVGMKDGSGDEASGYVWTGGAFSSVAQQQHIGLAFLRYDGAFAPWANVQTNGSVYSLTRLSTNRALAGGGFSQVSDGQRTEARTGLIRLESYGQVDWSFDPRVHGGVMASVEQPDGKILIAGFFDSVGGVARRQVARLHADGSLDPTFDAGWGPDSYVLSIALQPNGKVVIGGLFRNVDGVPRGGIARLNADGSLDTSFTLGTNGTVYALAVQPDGKILAGGDFTKAGGALRYRIARLHSNGTADSTFLVTMGANRTVRALALQPDGGVLAGGDFTVIGGEERGRIARLLPNGDLDPRFSRIGADERVNDLDLLANGRILIAGNFTHVAGVARSRVARLHADGTPDGVLSPAPDGPVLALALPGDGKVLVGGRFWAIGGGVGENLARLHADGTWDAGFAPGPNDTVRAIALQPDGRMLIGGAFTRVRGERRNYLARLNADGTLDGSFGTYGLNGEVRAIAYQPDGRILIGGDFTTVNGVARYYLARLHPDGSLDGAFDARIVYSASHRVHSLALQEDGQVVVGGRWYHIGGDWIPMLVRLRPDGSLDTSFRPIPNEDVKSVAVQPDGKILAGGDFYSMVAGSAGRYFVRLNADGTLDPTFRSGKAGGGVDAIQLGADGSIDLGGRFWSYDGDADHRYFVNLSPGGWTVGSSAFDRPVAALASQPDGRQVLGGDFTDLKGYRAEGVARVMARPQFSVHELSLDAHGSTLTWRRAGRVPEVGGAAFEMSTDGLTFTPIGRAGRIPGGWQLAGIHFPKYQRVTVRAYGSYPTGAGNGSVSIAQSFTTFYLTDGGVLLEDQEGGEEPAP